MTFLIFGDIMGRIGREAIKRCVPEFRHTYKPDLVIANAENLAHGAGISTKTIDEMRNAGVDVFTSGNHVFDNKEGVTLFGDPKMTERILRPDNYPPGAPGKGWTLLNIKEVPVLLVNLMGRVFFKPDFDDPFRAADRLLAEHSAPIILVDFHAEATSEKNTFSLYLDGRVTAVWGTHTHVPTADERILPKGTAYATDVGMTGGMNGSIGVKYEPVRDMFLYQRGVSFEPIETGPCEVNALLLTVENGRAASIERIRRIVDIA